MFSLAYIYRIKYNGSCWHFSQDIVVVISPPFYQDYFSSIYLYTFNSAPYCCAYVGIHVIDWSWGGFLNGGNFHIVTYFSCSSIAREICAMCQVPQNTHANTVPLVWREKMASACSLCLCISFLLEKGYGKRWSAVKEHRRQ